MHWICEKIVMAAAWILRPWTDQIKERDIVMERLEKYATVVRD